MPATDRELIACLHQQKIKDQTAHIPHSLRLQISFKLETVRKISIDSLYIIILQNKIILIILKMYFKRNNSPSTSARRKFALFTNSRLSIWRFSPTSWLCSSSIRRWPMYPKQRHAPTPRATSKIILSTFVFCVCLFGCLFFF